MTDLKKIPIPSGVDLVISGKRVEDYNRQLNIRTIGSDNLYYQHLRDFSNTSPTLSLCISRQVDALFGDYTNKGGFITEKLLHDLLIDYSLFGGFALHVTYDGFGEIDGVNHIPFECVRLGEKGSNGIYTQVVVCEDWGGTTTINKKKVNPRQDIQKYFLFSEDIETRLLRMENNGGAENYIGEVLYFSNTNGYPTSNCDSVLQYLSAEVGLGNIVLRDVRQSFLPSAIVSIPTIASEDADSFAESLSTLQGDNNSGKILLFEHNSTDEKVEMLPLATEGMDTRFENAKADCRNRIIDVYNQQCFIRLSEGSLGWSNDVIKQLYSYFNWSLRPQRNRIESELKKIDPTFEMKELVYQYDSVINGEIDSKLVE